MFAVVSIAGCQEKVTEGDKLRVPSLKVEEGKSVKFDTVLLVVKSDSDITIGTPYVAGATVEAKVIEHGRGEKIRVSKIKRRKRYRRVQGHRQNYTYIEITGIKVGAKKAAPKKEAEAKKEVKEEK